MSLMVDNKERDYVLGTSDDELVRLGLQHSVWRRAVLDCWQRAGITVGSRVLDLGAGPGYATLDLAEIVGSTGHVVAVDQSRRFIEAGRTLCQGRGFGQVRFYQLDLMNDPLPVTDFDAAWVRWVASFVSSPARLVASLADAVRPGGVAVFHEYADYGTWRVAPRSRLIEEFVQHVMESWRATGGEPDVALMLPTLLVESGFRVRSVIPRVFCVRPREYMWHWPSAFLKVNLDRLLELRRVDAQWAEAVRREFSLLEADPATIMVTPMVMEIIADRL